MQGDAKAAFHEITWRAQLQSQIYSCCDPSHLGVGLRQAVAGGPQLRLGAWRFIHLHPDVLHYE